MWGKLGTSVIDYAICNAEAWEEIESIKIADRTELDHRPIELTLEVQMEAEKERKKEEREIEDGRRMDVKYTGTSWRTEGRKQQAQKKNGRS